MKGIGFFLGVFFALNAFAQEGSRWRITKAQWTVQDEYEFGQFISSLGQAVARRECFSVQGCLRSPANPFYGSDSRSLRHYADCADLPYYLRAYFAWKKGLPMSFASSLSARVAGDNSDLRYTRYGNYVTDRIDIVDGRFWGEDAENILNSTIVNTTWSGSFRLIGTEDRGLYSDFYPVKLGREGIRPGTVIYDPNGHVAMVFKVTDDGHIFYIDAHPDNTLTAGMYSPKFARSHPFQGAGFKNFRPLILQGATRTYSGYYIGGRITGVRNAQLSSYSLEQFYGTERDPGGDWQKGKFIYRGNTLSYYDYLRAVMASGELRIDPLNDMRAMVADICIILKDRVVAVDLGIKAGIDRKEHPERLPRNIFGADGDWEAFATPARDARLKVTFMDLISQSKQLLARWRNGDPVIQYPGANLAADLLATYEQSARSCQFSYRTSAGRRVPLDLEESRRRLFDLSFDPYHCVELRWGAASPQERSSCSMSPNKWDWYNQERWLRYQWERRFDVRMDYSLDELTGPKPGAGIAAPPDVDIVSYLNSQK